MDMVLRLQRMRMVLQLMSTVECHLGASQRCMHAQHRWQQLTKNIGYCVAGVYRVDADPIPSIRHGIVFGHLQS